MPSLPDHLSAPQGERGKLPREVRESHQRERVVSASIDVFAKRGYRRTTVDHLVAASQVSFGTFYALFDGKEDCFLHVYDRILADGYERVVASVTSGLSWPEQVVVVLRSLVDLVAAEPMRARIALSEAQTGGPKALASYQEMMDKVIPHLRRGREETDGAKGLSPTLEEAILGGVAWLLNQQLLNEGPGSLQATLPELVDIVLGPYVGSERAAEFARAGATSA